MALWLTVQPSVRRAAQRLSGQRDVDDVVQDVAEQFFRCPNEFRSEAEARSWSRVVVEHRVIDLSRRGSATPVADLEGSDTSHATEDRTLCQLALDCARAYMRRRGISESWLLGDPSGEPVSAADRAEKSRLRKMIRAHVKEKVGWPALLPSWRWLTPAAVALAVVPIPFIAGLEPPETSTGAPNVPAAVDELAESTSAELAASQPTVPWVLPSIRPSPHEMPAPPNPGRVMASVPTPLGDAQWREFEPPPDEPPPPLLCAQNLRVAPDACVNHPLK